MASDLAGQFAVRENRLFEPQNLSIHITELGFDGEVAPLDAPYTAQGYVSYEVVYKFWAERIRTRLAALRELPVDARPAALAYTREEKDQAVRSYDWASLALAHLYHGPDVWTRGRGECNWQFLRPFEVWAYEYQIYPSGPESDTSAEARRIPRALADLLLTPWEGDAWAAYPPRALAEALTWSRVLLQGYWLDQYYLGERFFEINIATAQRRVPAAPPRHMCILEGMTPEDKLLEYDGSPADVYLIPSDYASYLTTRLQARLLEVREYSQDWRRHRTPAYYRAQAEADAPAGPAGAVLGDVPFPLGMEVALDPTLGLGPAIAIPADLRQAPPQLQLDPEHATHELEIGRLRRHQSRQTGAISRLQMEVDRLRTRLEVEGIPLDFSEEEDDDDDDGSSSDDAPTPLCRASGNGSQSEATLAGINARLPEWSTHKCPSNHYRQNQVSSFVQSILDDLWQIHPMNQLAWLKYFKDLKPDHSFLSWLVMYFNPNTMVFRFEDSEVTPTYEEMCAVMCHHPEQNETPALPPGPRDDLTEVYHRTVFMMIMGETMCWVRDIALHVTNFNVHHRGCPMLLQAWALDKLSLIPPVPARLIPTYGPANFWPRSQGQFDFGDNPVIRWTCP
ncbi:hypothetical protein JCGZ_02793 [Jatropha curcas]|uniref:Aminotransferase-like plant mobile domain-containing protein n=1 Tax=Jatropha curcas TaxID=180498 RepID=A0A067JFS6_JATCU|nr:hypothetical protein JCGZ_02793 [Jatropha curcas]